MITQYGDISRRKERGLLVNDMCDWVEANPVPWEGIELDREDITSRSDNLIDIFRLIYERRMAVDQASIWCCKSTFNLSFAAELEKYLKPFYIYLYRDGRDVACSFKKAIVGPKHTYHLARKWSDEQRTVLNFLGNMQEDRFISIAYEDLLNQPELVIRSLCERIGVSFESGMLHFYESRESELTAKSGEMWKNVLKPVIKDNTRKYLNELNREDIRLFESVAGRELRDLGYDGISTSPVDFNPQIAEYEILNKQMEEEARSKASAQDKQKRAKQNELLEKIRMRFGLNEKELNPA